MLHVPRTLLAAFALLLTATHCVEIDDRELEETDGSGSGGSGGTGGNPACQRDSDDTTCSICLKQNCCTELTACVSNSDCVNFSDCIYTCGTTDACIETCAGLYPAGTDPFGDLLSCNAELCTVECSG